MINVKYKNSTQGFTLLELLISTLLISLFSLLVTQITIQTSKGLSNVTNKAIDVQSAIRFANFIKYDFAGSKDVYMHSNTSPTVSDSNRCTSFDSTLNVWDSPAPNNSKPYVRGLFTVLLNEIPYNSGASDLKWIDPLSLSVGYEIRQNTYAGAKLSAPLMFELWRVICSGGATGPAQKVLALGNGTSILNLNPCGEYLKMISPASSSATITTASIATGAITYTASATLGSGFAVGNTVTVGGNSTAAYNVSTAVITLVPTTTTFKVATANTGTFGTGTTTAITAPVSYTHLTLPTKLL
jgi:prepilin-type N-terminal cleavage/methylation domain-containing protein